MAALVRWSPWPEPVMGLLALAVVISGACTAVLLNRATDEVAAT